MRTYRNAAAALCGALAMILTGCVSGPSASVPFSPAGDGAVRLVDEFDEYNELFDDDPGARRGSRRTRASRAPGAPMEISTMWGVRGGYMMFPSTTEIGEPDARAVFGLNLMVQFYREAKWMADFGIDVGMTSDGMDAIVYVARADLLFRPVQSVESFYLVGGLGYAFEQFGDDTESAAHVEGGLGYVLTFFGNIDLRAAYLSHFGSENVQGTLLITAGLLF